MATIGSMAVNLVATTDKFIGGINSARGSLGKFTKSISNTTRVVGALAVAGFGAIVKSALDAGGALFDLSAKLNISTEALTALNYAASQLGVKTESVHSSLTRLTRKLGEAQAGSAGAQQAFANLGVNYEQLLGLPIEQQFISIVDSLHKLPGVEERAAAASAIFGRSAAELNGFITAGADEMVRFGDEAARMGLIVSGEAAAALDSASDSLSKFEQMWAATKMNVVADYAPSIQAAVEFLGSVFNGLRISFLSASAAIMGVIEASAYAIKGFLDGINTLLPKAAEINSQLFGEIADSFGRTRQDLISKAADAWRGTNQVQGPLSNPNSATSPEQKQTANNTSETNRLLREQNELLRRQQQGQGPVLAPAGMR